ncbi:hypothetical protein HX853_06565, partial [Marine Group I thaumarchaeote]|nr:hypothetical protein [Marine Group I thaumarchaeote]
MDNVITAISSIIDFDLTGSTANSGLMTITLPYKEANIQEGTNESQLTMLHYENGAWITEDDCTIDEAANEITCIVTSLSPFAVGGKTSGGGGGCINCSQPYLDGDILVSVSSSDPIIINSNDITNIIA